ncbi:hypothetical protein TI04_02745 [Achromatium sp. WMS2]|nr:hypothetical protein TI04_02745 [Achromatium sp. WMS2]
MSWLHKIVDPWKAVTQELCLRGTVEISFLPRVKDLVVESAAKIDCELVFYCDPRHRNLIRGQISGNVQLTCQRCLEPISMELVLKPTLALIRDYAEMEQLPDAYEPLLVTNSQLRPLDIIEDELILALPTIPMHTQDASCSIPKSLKTDKLTNQEFRPSGCIERPFQVLEQMKHKLS